MVYPRCLVYSAKAQSTIAGRDQLVSGEATQVYLHVGQGVVVVIFRMFVTIVVSCYVCTFKFVWKESILIVGCKQLNSLHYGE